jgi:hypothetical protein
MAMMESLSSTDHGTTCAECGESLIAPDWSEYLSERLVLNLWSCPKCGCRFETEACMQADVDSTNDRMAVEAFLPSLLVP